MTKLALAFAAALLATAVSAQESGNFDTVPFGKPGVDHTKTFSIGGGGPEVLINRPGSVLSLGQYKSPADAANDRQNYGGR